VSFIFQPRLGMMKVEDSSRRVNSWNHPDFKKASQVVLPDQVSTLCLPAKKYLQLMLAQQQIENISVVGQNR